MLDVSRSKDHLRLPQAGPSTQSLWLLDTALDALSSYTKSAYTIPLTGTTNAVRDLIHVHGVHYSSTEFIQQPKTTTRSSLGGPAEKKVIDALTRLSVSTFVLQLPEISTPDDVARVGTNAARLQHALVAFGQLQRAVEEDDTTLPALGRKLRGVFSMDSAAAARHQYTSLSESAAERDGRATQSRLAVESSLRRLDQALSASGVGCAVSDERICSESQHLIACVSAHLSHLRQTATDAPTDEDIIESIHSDCALLFLAMQKFCQRASDDTAGKNRPTCAEIASIRTRLTHGFARLRECSAAQLDLETSDWDEDGAENVVKTPKKRDKISRLLGDDPPWIILERRQPDAKPWYLRPNRDPSFIAFDPVDGTIKGGTVEGLVECLTRHDHRDTTFRKAFLLTFRAFMTVDELLRLLVERFDIQPPPSLQPDELEEWRHKKQLLVQLGVLVVLKDMISEKHVLQPNEKYIIDQIKDFVTSEHVAHFNAAKTLKSRIDRLQRTGTLDAIVAFRGQPPPPIPPKNSTKLQLLGIDPLESARQLTILESKLYQSITPHDCFLRARGRKTEQVDSIKAVIDTSNKIADWVQTVVLRWEDPRDRAATIKQLISVAYQCLEIHNFTSMSAIVSGLYMPPVKRLKRTWERVKPKYIVQLQACDWMMSADLNFINERTTLLNTEPPCIPFIGRFLTAFQFINDGNKDELTPGGMINFSKHQKVGEVMQDLLRWQTHPHNFTPLPEVQAYLQDALHGEVAAANSAKEKDLFWNMSMTLEPRETTEEAMSRILHGIGM